MGEGEREVATVQAPWLLLLPSLILLCSHSPLVKLIKNFMPHAATLLRVCSMPHQSPPPLTLSLPVCYVRGRAVALSRCCQRSLRKVFSDFVLGLFAGTHQIGLPQRLIWQRTCNLLHALCCCCCMPCGPRPGQVRVH